MKGETNEDYYTTFTFYCYVSDYFINTFGLDYIKGVDKPRRYSEVVEVRISREEFEYYNQVVFSLELLDINKVVIKRENPPQGIHRLERETSSSKPNKKDFLYEFFTCQEFLDPEHSSPSNNLMNTYIHSCLILLTKSGDIYLDFIDSKGITIISTLSCNLRDNPKFYFPLKAPSHSGESNSYEIHPLNEIFIDKEGYKEKGETIPGVVRLTINEREFAYYYQLLLFIRMMNLERVNLNKYKANCKYLDIQGEIICNTSNINLWLNKQGELSIITCFPIEEIGVIRTEKFNIEDYKIQFN